MKISGLNGNIKANVGLYSSYYSKNALGKFTDKNMLDTILKDRPQQYDRIIKLFTQSKLYSNDFTELIMSNGTPFFIDEPDGQFEYKLHKYSELPKIIENLADTNATPGIDGQEFELVFDKKVFVTNDIITAHRREQEVQLQVVEEPVNYQNYFKYKFRAIGQYADSYVSQRFLAVGTEYIKIGNRIGEYTTDLSTLGMIDGHLTVTTEGLMEYGIESTMTEYARLKKIQKDQYGKPLDITYYSVTSTDVSGQPINLTLWEPTMAALMRAEMMKMKANMLLWGRQGMAKDEKGRPTKVYAGLWQQMHLGNIVYYNRGQFTMNTLRYTLDNLFHGRVAIGDRKAKVFTNRAGFQLIEKAIREDALSQGFTFNAENYVKGKDNLKLGFMFGFDHYHSKETGDVEFIELEQLNEAVTFLEQGPNKRVSPIFIILDVSGSASQTGIRELKLSSRPNMLSAYIPGVTGFNGAENVLAASKDPWQTWVMKDFTGIFLEDPTRTVIIKEYPQF